MKNGFKKIAKRLFASTIILSTVAAPAVTLAQDYDTLINDTQLTIDNLSAQQAALYNELALGYQALDALRAEADELLKTIEEDNTRITELNEQISELEVLIGKRKDLLADQARAVQVNGGTTNYLNLVASSESISDFVGRLDIVRKMVSSNKDLLTTQKEDKEAVVKKQAEVEAAKEEKINKQIELEQLKAQLETQQEANEVVYGQLTNDLSLAAEHRDALVAEKQAYEEQQAILAAQAQAIAEAQAAAEAAQQAAAEAQANAEAQAVAAQQAQAQADVAAQEASQQVETPAIPEVTEEVVPATESENVTESVETPQVAETANEAAAVAQQATEAQAAAEAQRVAAEAEAARLAAEAEAQRVAAETAAQAATEAAQAAETATGNVNALLSNAAQHLGTPYVWGGKNPSGFDCSGFVQYVYKQTYGVDVGGWTVAQESAGTRIGVSEAQPGDLYFWGESGGTYHVAIATGNGQYIHASQPGTPLEYNSVSNFTPTFAVRVNK